MSGGTLLDLANGGGANEIRRPPSVVRRHFHEETPC
jgi:hypothetical protein